MNNQRGFTLILSTIIISTVFLLIGITTANQLFGQIENTLGGEDFFQAKILAEGCADAALIELSYDSAYNGNEMRTINGASCTIRPVTTSGPTATIETEAEVNDRIYRLRVEVSNTNPPITVSSWQRVTTF